MRRIAHFLQNPYLHGSPPNDALVSAYQEMGYGVDLFSMWDEGARPRASEPSENIRFVAAQYSARWLATNVWRPSWGRYEAFSSTTEEPLAAVGWLSRIWRRPLIVLADEIRSGSYWGRRGKRWKNSCRRSMRHSALTIVNEPERVQMQREYANLPPEAPIVVYPGAFRDPPRPADRNRVRAERGIPESAIVMCYSGNMSFENGGLWLTEALRQRSSLWALGQIVNLDPLLEGLLTRVQGADRLVLERRRLGWREAWASVAAADIGLAVYLQDAPQFRHMGIASNRLCMFLSMGVPVIASRQPSFEFVEDYDCGVLVDDTEQIGLAVDRIVDNLAKMRMNALTCAREHIRAQARWQDLRAALSKVLAG